MPSFDACSRRTDPGWPGSLESCIAVRLLTVNAHKGFTFLNRRFILHELRDAVRSVGADIVFLQEIHGSHAEHALRHANWPTAPQYEFLADTIWRAYAYGRNCVYPAGDHGNAVLSKFPIERYVNRDVSVQGPKKQPEKRGLLHCVLSLPGHSREVHAVCVHLGLHEAHRRHQVDLLCKMIREEVPDEAPLLIAGDFNDWRVRVHDVLTHSVGLEEIFVASRGRAARTFPSRLPLFSLDRIYVRGVRAHRPLNIGRRPWSRLSDHAPLAAEVMI